MYTTRRSNILQCSCSHCRHQHGTILFVNILVIVSSILFWWNETTSISVLATTSSSFHANLDPYTILGLSCDASSKDVRSRYHRLCKQYHPDKLSCTASNEERRTYEEKFKAVRWAYDEIACSIRSSKDPSTAQQDYHHQQQYHSSAPKQQKQKKQQHQHTPPPKQKQQQQQQRPSQKQPFEVLGVSIYVTPIELSSRYNSLCSMYHPDKYKNVSNETRQNAEQKYHDIQMAYSDIYSGNYQLTKEQLEQSQSRLDPYSMLGISHIATASEVFRRYCQVQRHYYQNALWVYLQIVSGKDHSKGAPGPTLKRKSKPTTKPQQHYHQYQQPCDDPYSKVGTSKYDPSILPYLSSEEREELEHEYINQLWANSRKSLNQQSGNQLPRRQKEHQQREQNGIRNPYKILGVKMNASLAGIRRQYRHLCVEYDLDPLHCFASPIRQKKDFNKLKDIQWAYSTIAPAEYLLVEDERQRRRQRVNNCQRNEFRDPYKILGITYESSIDEIKCQYYKLYAKHYPTQYPYPQCLIHQKLIKDICWAYLVIVMSIYH